MRRSSYNLLTVAYMAAVVAGGAGALTLFLVLGGGNEGDGLSPVAFWLLAALVLLGELRPLPIHLRRETVAITTSTAPAFALLLLAGPLAAILALAVATVATDLASRRCWWKVAFNASQYVLSAAAAGVVLAWLSPARAAGSEPLFRHPMELPPIAAAGLAFFAVNLGVMAVGAALAQGQPVRRVLGHGGLWGAVPTAALLAMAPVLVIVVDQHLVLLPLLLVPLVLVHRSAAVSVERYREAREDGLTGLPSRLALREQLAAAGEATAGGGATPDALLVLNLDRFRDVNDSLGHQAGDELLREVGRRLAEALGASGSVARLGGDEFAVFLPQTEAVAAVDVALRLLGAFDGPITVRDVPVLTRASIGVVTRPQHGEDLDVLLRRAETAMHEAKALHTPVQVYDPAQDQSSPERFALVAELQEAVAGGGLALCFQPKVRLDDGATPSVEALVRWPHPSRGWISPAEFIPLAERTGIISPLTRWVLDTALAQCRRWADEGIDVSVAVNVSARVLQELDLPHVVADLLRRHRVAPGRLILEITESMIMADPDGAVAALRRLDALGVEVAVDDYGTGHSSLSYLKQLPIRELKLDKSFVMGMGRDRRDAVIVRSTLELGHQLGLRVVAEGVEDEETALALAALGCDLAQGYHFARPLPAGELAGWVRSRVPVAS